FPARQWIEKRQDAFESSLLRSWRRNLSETLRPAVSAVALTKVRVLNWKAAVVVKRRAPKHRAVRHHAFADRVGLGAVAFRTAAGLGRYPQVAGIEEA